jgi:hypothetical protein
MERFRRRAFSHFQGKPRFEEEQWLLSGLSCLSPYSITLLDTFPKAHSSSPHTFRYIMAYPQSPAQHNDGQAFEDGATAAGHVPL